MKKRNVVVWDIYGIRNNPTDEAVKSELEKLLKVQKKQIEGWNHFWDMTIKRQKKINILKRMIEQF